MTKPAQILESVVSRFPMLLHSEPDKLNALLVKAIGKYQDLAGFMGKCRFTETDIQDGAAALPEYFLTNIVLKDANGRYVCSEAWGDSLEIELTGYERFPLTFQYLENLRDADYDKIDIPADAINLLSDYLELLIMSPNSDRLRRVVVAGKLDASDIPTESELATRRTELEEKIRAAKAMIPMITI